MLIVAHHTKPNALTACTSHGCNLYPILTDDHMYAFEVETGELTSIELVFMFALHPVTKTDAWKIIECGILTTRGLPSS